MTDIFNDKAPIRKQLERARRELVRYKRAEEEATKPKFNFGKWLDRQLLELAVHIPVGVAIGISCFGWEQYGMFAAGLVPLTIALSFLLSRTYSMALRTHRYDVAAFLAILGFLAFCVEAYGVHLGLERFNHENAAGGLQTFSDEILIVVSVMLGLMNVFSRRAFVTGHDEAADDTGRPESWWRFNRRREKFNAGIARNDGTLRLSQITDEQAIHSYERNGAWPLGYQPTAAARAAVAA